MPTRAGSTSGRFRIHIQAARDLGDLDRRQAGANQPHPFVDPIANVIGKTVDGK